MYASADFEDDLEHKEDDSSSSEDVSNKKRRSSLAPKSKMRNRSKHEISLERKSRDAVKVAIDMLAYFNGGDISSLRELIDTHFHSNCSLKTPALEETLFGRNYIIDYYIGLLAAHADAVIFGKNFRYQNREVGFRVYFAGSKTHSTENDFLFKSDKRSRIDEMKSVDQLLPEEIARLKAIEDSGQSIAVQGRGCFVLKFNEENQVYAMDCTWEITSFAPVEIR